MNTCTLPAAFAAAALLLGTLPARAVDHFVSPTGGHVPPFTSWADAATNLQAAVDAASAGETVWVTNGVYATGGKVMVDDLTNRVALDKPLTLASVAGPDVTVIEGGGYSGATAVRAVWMTNGATLRGFTVRRGATRNTFSSGDGGGVWCASSSATITNCVVTSNTAVVNGGGVYRGTLLNSVISTNYGQKGGGTYMSTLQNCLVVGNSASSQGGGCLAGILNNCTVVGNTGSSVVSPKRLELCLAFLNVVVCSRV
jgi:hypothetical protein